MLIPTRNAPTLLIDCHSVLHAQRFNVKQYASNVAEAKSRLIYAFLVHINMLIEHLNTRRFLFAWDHPLSIRREKYPFYKQRKPGTVSTAEENMDRELIQTFSTIRDEVVPCLGFMHNHCYAGFEADDIIAATVLNNNGNFLLLSSDHDLMQLLHRCSIYRTKTSEIYTERHFLNDYGIPSTQWAEVKAIAGCSSDTVPGIAGVGEKTAIKYLRNELKETTKAYKGIVSPEGQAIIERNRGIVTLPLENCPIPDMEYKDARFPKHAIDEIAEIHEIPIARNQLQALRGLGGR